MHMHTWILTNREKIPCGTEHQHSTWHTVIFGEWFLQFPYSTENFKAKCPWQTVRRGWSVHSCNKRVDEFKALAFKRSVFGLDEARGYFTLIDHVL